MVGLPPDFRCGRNGLNSPPRTAYGGNGDASAAANENSHQDEAAEPYRLLFSWTEFMAEEPEKPARRNETPRPATLSLHQWALTLGQEREAEPLSAGRYGSGLFAFQSGCRAMCAGFFVALFWTRRTPPGITLWGRRRSALASLTAPYPRWCRRPPCRLKPKGRGRKSLSPRPSPCSIGRST